MAEDRPDTPSPLPAGEREQPRLFTEAEVRAIVRDELQSRAHQVTLRPSVELRG